MTKKTKIYEGPATDPQDLEQIRERMLSTIAHEPIPDQMLALAEELQNAVDTARKSSDASDSDQSDKNMN